MTLKLGHWINVAQKRQCPLIIVLRSLIQWCSGSGACGRVTKSLCGISMLQKRLTKVVCRSMSIRSIDAGVGRLIRGTQDWPLVPSKQSCNCTWELAALPNASNDAVDVHY